MFAPIDTVHPYSTRTFTCHVMHRARALSTKMNNDRADGQRSEDKMVVHFGSPMIPIFFRSNV